MKTSLPPSALRTPRLPEGRVSFLAFRPAGVARPVGTTPSAARAAGTPFLQVLLRSLSSWSA